MNLKEYLYQKNINLEEFSRQVNYDKNYLSNIACGSKKPGIKLARIISKATGGSVTIDELLNYSKNSLEAKISNLSIELDKLKKLQSENQEELEICNTKIEECI